MICDEFMGSIDAYLDDELPIMDILRAHGHVRSCEFCPRILGSEGTPHSLLAGDAIRDQPPWSVRDRIIRRVAAEERAGLSTRRAGSSGHGGNVGGP
jgi:hypothetical protein